MASINEVVTVFEATISGLPVISTCYGLDNYIYNSMGRIFPITNYKGIVDV